MKRIVSWTLLFLLLWPAAAAAVRFDTAACRGSVEAAMKGDVDAAIAALEPKPSEQDGLRDAMERLVGGLKGVLKGETPRLERTLPDTAIETGPVALQIWSFGDKLVYIFGCHVRQRPNGHVDIFFEARPSVDFVLKEIQAKMPK
jgi:hypothetical protein